MIIKNNIAICIAGKVSRYIDALNESCHPWWRYKSHSSTTCLMASWWLEFIYQVLWAYFVRLSADWFSSKLIIRLASRWCYRLQVNNKVGTLEPKCDLFSRSFCRCVCLYEKRSRIAHQGQRIAHGAQWFAHCRASLLRFFPLKFVPRSG